MAGNGGGTGYTSAAEYLQDSHYLMLSGQTVAPGEAVGHDWNNAAVAEDQAVIRTGAYAENPSVLRFIVEKGITDVGGNPFDGVSTYDPEDDLAEIDEQYDALKEGIDARVAETDVNAHVTNALAKRSDIISTIDTDSVFRDALDTSFASLNSKFSNAFEDSRVAVQAVLDTIVARARDSSDETAGVIINAARSIMDSLYATALVEAKVDAGDILDTAILDGRVQADDSLNRSITAMQRGDAVVDGQFSKTRADVVESIRSMVTESLEGTLNLESGISLRVGSTSRNLLSESLLAGRTEAKDEIEEVISIVTDEVVAALITIDENTLPIVAGLMSAASSQITMLVDTYQATAHAQALANAASVKEGFSTDADSRVGDAVIAAYMGADKFLRMAISAASEAIAADVVDPLVEEYRRQALKTHLRSVNRFAGGMADINAVQSSTFVIGMAIKEAEYTSDVNKFQGEFMAQMYFEALRTFATSSNFLVNAYMQVFASEYDGHLRTYIGAKGDYVNSILSLIPQYIGAYLQSVTSQLGASMQGYSTIAAKSGQIALGNMQAFGNLSALYGDAATRLASNQTQTELGLNEFRQRTAMQLAEVDNQVFARIVEAKLNVLGRLFNIDKGDILRTVMGARLQAYTADYAGELDALGNHMNSRAQTLSYALSNQLQGSFQTKLSEKADSMRATFELLNDYLNYDDRTEVLENSIMQLLTEYKRVKFVMKTEQYTRDLEYDAKSANWDMELFQKAGNILSAYTGSVVPTAGQPSPAQSALGGALAGASIGTQVAPGVGTAIGAGVGALASLLLNS